MEPADQLAGFARIEVDLAGEAWTVALADAPDLRAQGLRGVTDLGDARGMLFSWEADTASAFTMRDTLIALEIAFFAADGSEVGRLSMVPCDAEPCPSYRVDALYRWALEVPAGGFEGLGTLTLAVP